MSERISDPRTSSSVQSENESSPTPAQQQAASRDSGNSDRSGLATDGPVLDEEARLKLEDDQVPVMTPATGVLDGDTIRFRQIEVPRFKVSDHRQSRYERPLIRNKDFTPASRSNTRQRDVWKEALGQDTDAVQATLRKKYVADYGEEEKGGSYVFTAPSKYSKDQPVYFIGDLATIARELTLPTWDRRGEPHDFHVDHILELQLSNWPGDQSWANTMANMELLDGRVNMSSGSSILNNIDGLIRTFIDSTDGYFGRDPATIKRSYHLSFDRAIGVERGGQPGPADFWRDDEIQDGLHLDPVKPASLADLGGNGYVRIFPTPAGGRGKQFSIRGAEGAPAGPDLNRQEHTWLKPLVIQSKKFFTQGEDVSSNDLLGVFAVNMDPKSSKFELLSDDQEIQIYRLHGARYVGAVDRAKAREIVKQARFKHLSPIRLDTFEISFEDGLYAAGAILPETPLIADLDIAFEMRGFDLSVYKAFSPEELDVPKPFVVRDSSLVISLGTEKGLAIEGEVDFSVEHLGEGQLRGSADRGSGLSLEGSFAFDPDLFAEAEIDLWYKDDALGARGTLGIGPNSVRGIRSGRVTVEYSGETFLAEGTVEPDIPGVKEGRLLVSFSEEEGLMIGGGLDLANDVPGIQAGTVDVKVRKSESGWSVFAEGTAVPDIPGVDATLNVRYDDGLFTVEGSAKYERGMMAGQIELGVTNRSVDESGEPGEETTGQLRAYGGGSLRLQLAPWLVGTVGVRLLENGEIEVSGSVGLPDTLELFEEIVYERTLFRSPPVDIPIIGVAAAGQRIGIFATIRGGLEARAGIGPGQLQEVSVGVTYNPDREHETHVRGRARLHVPAEAGLRLYVRGGVGAGIPLVSATAGLEVGGQLGLAGALDAGVDVDWTPEQGLVIDAFGEVSVSPKFRFDMNAFASVELDVFLTTITLFEDSWELAAFEYGSDLRFGLKFPVHYAEGEPFNLSLEDVELDVPDIDVKELISDLVRDIV